MPPLIKFVIKWSAIGIGLGWLVLAALLVLDVGGIGSMVRHQRDGMIAIFILALSFAVTSGQLTVTAAVLLRKDFGGTGPSNSRLERWRAGHSAELDEDRPLP